MRRRTLLDHVMASFNRKWPWAVLSIFFLTGALLLVSSRPQSACGGYEFRIRPTKDAQRAKVEYLSYGDHHELLTCGPRQATQIDVCLNRFVKWLGIQRHFTPVAYLSADHNRNDQELALYISFENASASPPLPDVLSAYYVNEHQERSRMQFAIGKSNAKRTKHLVAWKISLSAPPTRSCRVEIVQSDSGRELAVITDMRARNQMSAEP